MSDAAPLCNCGQPCPRRPSHVGFRPRCDACERQLVLRRKRESMQRTRTTSSGVKAMSRAQKPWGR